MANFQFRGFWIIFWRGHRCKRKISEFFYTYDPFKKCSKNPEIENLPLIHLPIYKKIFVSGPKSKIFINKVDFGPVAYLVKLLQFGLFKKIFMPNLLLLSKKFTMQSNSSVGAVTQDLEFVSKLGNGWGCPTHKGGPQTKNFLAGEPYPWVGQTTQVSAKSERWPFAMCFSHQWTFC